LLYEVVIVAAARLRGYRVCVHHHSFRYLDQDYWPMRVLVAAAGKNTLHVVLGDVMARRLSERYPRTGEPFIMNNAALVGAPVGRARTAAVAGPWRIGYLANLTAEKGIDDFLRLAETCSAESRLHFVVAGPFEQSASEPAYRKRFAALPNLEYCGAVYGEAKQRFWSDIDVFVFPTRYRHEADPLVVHEALRAGCPVIAFGRGCIPGLVSQAGLVVPLHEDFCRVARTELLRWQRENRLAELSLAALDQFGRLHRDSLAARDKLIQRISCNSSN
jgi:glycosyltransferase involved in cell wall biosynthesis